MCVREMCLLPNEDPDHSLIAKTNTQTHTPVAFWPLINAAVQDARLTLGCLAPDAGPCCWSFICPFANGAAHEPGVRA